MTFFNPYEPVFRRKQHALDVQDLHGAWQLRFQIGSLKIPEIIFTRIDQVFLLWAAITAGIFTTAQFAPFDWLVQAEVWSALSALGIALTLQLAWYWARVERSLWIIFGWIGLIAVGLVLTALGIATAWAEIVLHLGPLWLVLCGLGYLGTGIGLRSRALLFAALIHIAAVPLVEGSDWAFLLTGLILSGTLLLFAASQWDMRLPIDYRLARAERVFNDEQQLLRLGRR